MRHGATRRQRLGQRRQRGGIMISQQQLRALCREGAGKPPAIDAGRAGDDHFLPRKAHGAVPLL